MTDESILISTEGALGIIALNRPKAINALTRSMIDEIASALKSWKSDPNMQAVMIEGNGAKGFCAGGDVRQVTRMIASGEEAKAQEFFEAEYATNLAIATYQKPIIALTHGVVMGGGIGLASHARFHLASDDARFAMPESAIGFFCDVGVRSILASAPRHQALAFMLSGAVVGAGDAVALGLADAIYPADQRADIRAQIVEAASGDDIVGLLSALQDTLATSISPAPFCDNAASLREIFEDKNPFTLLEALSRAHQNPEAEKICSQIARKCPTTHCVSILSFDAALHNPDISAVLAKDLIIAKWISMRPDFIEGVRAVLEDKDNSPSWTQIDLSGPHPKLISMIFELLT